MPFETFLIRLGISMLAGFLIGLERELKNKDAGLRTHIMVSLGATVYLLVSFELLEEGSGDVTRIVSQIVTGIGFLGAGVILQKRGDIRGLTTAATIWVTAAVGCLAGLGLIWETTVTTVAIIIVNAALHFLENKFIDPDKKKKSETP